MFYWHLLIKFLFVKFHFEKMESELKNILKKLYKETEKYQLIHQKTSDIFAEMTELQSLGIDFNKNEDFGILSMLPETMKNLKFKYLTKMQDYLGQIKNNLYVYR